MPQEREAVRTLAEFVKFTTLGSAVAGRVKLTGRNDNGDFITISPALVRKARGASWERFADVAVGLTTDLSMKVSARDVGKFLVLEFNDTEPSRKGQPKKLFRVFELSLDEMKGLVDGSFQLSEAAPKVQTDLLDEDDDLPF